MHAEYWVVSFWIARLLETLGLARRIKDSQSSTSSVRARGKKRSGSSPYCRQGAKIDNTLQRVTVEIWAGNPVSAGGVARQPTLSV